MESPYGRLNRGPALTPRIVVPPPVGVKTAPRYISVKKPPFPAPPGRRWIFVKYFKHWRSGKLVYPKTAECFCFLVRS